MRARVGLFCAFLLLLGTSAVAQIGGHPTDTAVVNGTLSLWQEECYDDYFFTGRQGQILWADIDSSWYVKQNGIPGIMPGFCLQVIDREGELVCWSAGQSIGLILAELIDGVDGFGWNPANACVIPRYETYTLRVAVNNFYCGEAPVECDGWRDELAVRQGLRQLPRSIALPGLEPLAFGLRIPGQERPERPGSDLEVEQLPENGYYELEELPYLLNVSLRNQATEGHIFGAINGSRNLFPRP